MTVQRSSARICLIVLARSYQRASEPKWRRGEDWCAAAADSWRSTGVYRQGGGSSRAPDHRKNRGHGTESAFAVGKTHDCCLLSVYVPSREGHGLESHSSGDWRVTAYGDNRAQREGSESDPLF